MQEAFGDGMLVSEDVAVDRRRGDGLSHDPRPIVYDSVITTDGEDLQNIKEVVVDGDKGVCSCTLYVSNSGSIWTLYIYYHNVSCDNSKNVYAEYSYIESFANKPQKTIHCTRSMPLRVGDNQVASGSLTGDNRSMCIPKSIKAWACFDNANQN